LISILSDGTVWKYSDFRNAKDVKTEIDNTLRVSAPLRPCVKLENNNEKDAKTRWRKEQKSPCVFHWNFRLCPVGYVLFRISSKSEGNSKKWQYTESLMMVLVLSSGTATPPVHLITVVCSLRILSIASLSNPRAVIRLIRSAIPIRSVPSTRLSACATIISSIVSGM